MKHQDDITVTLTRAEWNLILTALQTAPTDKGSDDENSMDMLAAHLEAEYGL